MISSTRHRLVTRNTQLLFLGPWRSLSHYSLQSVRTQSTTGGGGGTMINSRPSYQIYSDEVAFSIKSMAPEFRLVGASGKTLVLDKKGKLLLEWVPKVKTTTANKFAWDRPLRFALSPEEVGLVVARWRQGHSVEIHRSNKSLDYDMNSSKFGGNTTKSSNSAGAGAGAGSAALKVFRVAPLPGGGGVRMVCDYELDGQGGQASPENESQGPLGIDLMVGESQVVQSILEYSLPRLTGWTALLDHSVDHSFSSAATVPNPHNYGGSGGGGYGGGGGGRTQGGVPF